MKALAHLTHQVAALSTGSNVAGATNAPVSTVPSDAISVAMAPPPLAAALRSATTASNVDCSAPGVAGSTSVYVISTVSLRIWRRRVIFVATTFVTLASRPLCSSVFFIVVTYVLSGIDAILTLTLLELGVAEEANPFMHMLLAENIHLFAGVKALVTGLGLICLTAYSNQCLFTTLRVDRLIYILFAVYSLLVIYEVSLLRIAESARWLSNS